MSDLRLPGMIDAHVHLREPGGTHKEDILSGTRAALAGGVVGVLDMPNNTPPVVDRQSLSAKQTIFERKAVSDYGLFLGFQGGDLDDLVDAAGQAVGLKLYLDETFGRMTMRDDRLLEAVFEAWPGPGPITIHAESESIPGALDLAHRYRQRVHVAHVPQPDDLLVIESARQRGVEVTCEVTPHHLFLSDDDLPRLGAYGQMKPPLIPAAQVELFWERLALVDMIASDHAPHARDEKDSDTPPPGVPGLETTLPLLLYAVDAGRLSPVRMIELIYHNPLRVYGLSGPVDTEVEVALEGVYRFPERGYQTRCGWTPFAGQPALGRIVSVRLHGQIVYRDGEVLATPGFGRLLVRA